jgi:hypothetical protein
MRSRSRTQEPAGAIGFACDLDTGQGNLARIERFLPHMVAMGAGWLVLRTQAMPVPEAAEIARRLNEAGVEPLVHLLPRGAMEPAQVKQSADEWVRGGVRYIALDDRPNTVARWSYWQPHLLPQRYSRWLMPRLEMLASYEGVIPVFPPLAPGGDFWDTAFLTSALKELRALNPPWLHRLAVTCINDIAGRPVTWGRGGPAFWGDSLRGSHDTQEDQIGFRGWEWTRQIAETRLERPVVTLALSTGLTASANEADRAAEVRVIRHALAHEQAPPHLGATFYLYAETARQAAESGALFLADGTPVQAAVIDAFRQPVEAKRMTRPLGLPATVRIRLEDGSVECLELETYIRGVLAAEMSPGAPTEALKAQAIAARSYAARAVEGARHADSQADVCSTEHCQLWRPHYHARTDQAVRETAGMVATRAGRIISAYSFPCCAGRTRDSEEVWRAHLDYCRATPCVVKGEPQQGHGVGLCRRGAIVMAHQGASYEDILRHYYQGISIRAIQNEEPPSLLASSACREPAIRVERRAGVRALAGTALRIGQPVIISDPWGNRYQTISGSRPEVGPNGWEVRVPIDALYQVQVAGRTVEVALQGDYVVLHAA